MNISRGRVALNAIVLFPIAAACLFAGPALAQVTCSINPMTGRYEAALAWQNTLGTDRANAMCRSLEVNATAQARDIATSQGTAAPIQKLASQGATPVAAAQIPTPATDAIARQVMAQMGAHPSVPVSTLASATSKVVAAPPAISPMAVASAQSSVAPVVAHAVASAPVSQAAAATPGVFTFAVAPNDQTFREVIGKWSSIAGWSFTPDDWAMKRDIPVGGADVFTGTFKGAVIRLLKSSLLSDAPVRPCFYSNHVVRVIPASELCQRTTL